jgi:hypothetical protein
VTDDILPSEEFWTSIGFEPRKIIGHIDGPAVRAGLTEWSSDDFVAVCAYTGEIELGPQIRRANIPGLVQRNARKATSLLTLLSRYTEEVSSGALREVAALSGLDPKGIARKTLALTLFLKDPELIRTASYRALTKGFQSARPFITEQVVSKSRLTSPALLNRLEEGVSQAPSLQGKRVRIDRTETQRGSDVVRVFIKHEDAQRKVPEFDSYHWDKPILWTILTFYPKARGLEIQSSRRKVMADVAKVTARVVLGAEGAYTPLNPAAQVPETATTPPKTSVEMVRQALRGLSGAEVELDGSPSLTIEGTEVSKAIRELRKFKGIDLTRDIVGWEVRIAYKRQGVTKETTVSRWGRSASISFHPPVPYDVKIFIYDLIRRGSLPRVPLA